MDQQRYLALLAESCDYSAWAEGACSEICEKPDLERLCELLQISIRRSAGLALMVAVLLEPVRARGRTSSGGL